MREYVYPKVPNYYHDSVPDAFFNEPDLTIMEKLDGSNCKICMYDDRYNSMYGESIHDQNPDDGDVFISSKNVVRGRLSDPIDQFDAAFTRLVSELRDRLTAPALRTLHTEYNSPLVLFGEHMVQHTLDYGYGESPPPAFLGFDVLQVTRHCDPPANPFDERFTGYIPIDEMQTVFDRVDLPTVPVIEHQPGSITNPEEITIPVSEYANVKAEGVVFRSDSRSRRVKFVTEEFRERAQSSWGVHESDAESGVELFSARYLTNARIRKTVNKLLHRNTTDHISPERIATAAIADAWDEELADIRQISIPITPHRIFPEAITRARAVLDTMQTNAELNNTSLPELWSEHYESTTDSTVLHEFEPARDTITRITHRITDTDTGPEPVIVNTLLSEQQIHTVAERLVATDDRDIGRWVLTPIVDELTDYIWTEHTNVIAQLPVTFTPTMINDAVVELVIDVIENRDDVVIDEKPDDWEPDISDADPTGLDSLF